MSVLTLSLAHLMLRRRASNFLTSIGAAIALASLALVTTADGADLSSLSPSLLLNFDIGIDSSTRDWLTKLEDNFFTDIHKELKDDLHLIDESVDKHLDKVNTIIDRQIDHIACIFRGESTGIVARLFGLFENPLTNLQAYHDRVKLIFSFYRTDPNTFFSYYSDFLVNAHNIFCEVRYVDPIVANKVDEMQQDIRWRGAVWYRLSGHCVTVSGCWNWLEDDVQKAIKNYDGHDVATVHGQERFDEIMSRYPPTGISYNSWDIGQILHRWDPTSVESNFSGLFRIEDAITEARLYRLAKEAVDAYYRASYIKDHDKVDISYAEDNLGKDAHGAFCRARDALSKTP